MKKMNFISILLIIVFVIVSCAKMEMDEIGIDPMEPQAETIEMLENGNELITYPNGIRLERTPEGKMFWQGDILLSEEQARILAGRETRSLINFQKPWTDGIIYYEWSPTIQAATKSVVTEAMENWYEACGLLFFDITDWSNRPNNRIYIFNGNGNYSAVGMKGGRQDLSISSNNVTTAMHELGHAIGLHHEQCRYDRDYYINVNYDNIKPGKRHNFDKVPSTDYSVSSEFDYSSIMIYNSYVSDPNFVYDPSIPVMTKKDGTSFWSSSRPTTLDIKAVNNRYRTKVYTVKAACECSLSGTISGTDDYNYMSICYLTANPNPGRKLEGWYENGKKLSSSSKYGFNVTEDRNILAKFTTTNNTYSVETSVSIHFETMGGSIGFFKPGGSVTPGSHSSSANRAIAYTAEANLGYIFSHWEDVDSGATLSKMNPYYTSVKRDIRIKAVFTKGFIRVN